jgi:hypothetical protein
MFTPCGGERVFRHGTFCCRMESYSATYVGYCCCEDPASSPYERLPPKSAARDPASEQLMLEPDEIQVLRM